MPAEPVERELLLKVLVRAATALKHPGLVSIDEAQRWRLTNPLDSRAMPLAGLVRAEVGDEGDCRPVWRHEEFRDPVGARGARRW
ncbi:MAG: hypothetical protein ACRDT4_05715 [Micromonosporaceae bacterium]